MAKKAPMTPCPNCGEPMHPRKRKCDHCGFERPEAAGAANPGERKVRRVAPSGITMTAAFEVLRELDDFADVFESWQAVFDEVQKVLMLQEKAGGAEELLQAITYLAELGGEEIE